MKVSLECTYCGYKWIAEVYNRDSLSGKTCTRGNCKHKQLIARDLTNKVDYYEGSPPFSIEIDLKKLKEWL